jgi:hypothetical protein
MTALQAEALGTIHRSDNPSLVRPAGAALALGAAGVVATCVFYALSPPHAAMPVVPLDLAMAFEGAVRGRATMYWAGLAGVPADVVITAAGLLLGMAAAARGRGLAAMGWFLIGISTVLFAIVDALVGFVLPPLAAAGDPGFLAAKRLFDVLFLASTATFGAGAVLALLTYLAEAGGVPRVLALPALLVGLVALAGGMAGLLGASVNPHLLGVGIAGGAVLFTLIGAHLAATGRL